MAYDAQLWLVIKMCFGIYLRSETFVERQPRCINGVSIHNLESNVSVGHSFPSIALQCVKGSTNCDSVG